MSKSLEIHKFVLYFIPCFNISFFLISKPVFFICCSMDGSPNGQVLNYGQPFYLKAASTGVSTLSILSCLSIDLRICFFLLREKYI